MSDPQPSPSQSFPLVRMEDIAEALSLSKATVSRALNNQRHVSPATRKRVLEYAAQAGYAMDPALQALSRRRWDQPRAGFRYHCAFIDTGLPHHKRSIGGRHELYSRFWEEARRHGVQISEFNLIDYRSTSALNRVLDARGIDGIILNIKDPVIPWEFDWDRFSFLSLGLGCEQARTIASDWVGVLRLIGTRCRELGYTRPGFVRLDHGNLGIDSRIDLGLLYERELFSARCPEGLPETLVLPAETRDPRVYPRQQDRFYAWLDRERPDVVVDGSLFCAGWLAARGWAPGDAPGVCTHFRNFTPQLAPVAGVDHNYAEQAVLALEQILSMMQHRVRGLPKHPARIVVPCSWVDGSSLPEKAELRPGPARG